MPQRSLLPRMLNDSIHRELIARLHFRGAEVLDHVDDDGLQGVRSLRYTIDEHRCCRRNPLPHCRASRCSSGCNLPEGKFGALAGPCNHRLQAHRYIHRGREGLPVALIDWLAALSDARPDARCALDKLRVRVPRGAGSRPTREPAHRFEKLCKDGSRGRRRCDGGVFAEA